MNKSQINALLELVAASAYVAYSLTLSGARIPMHTKYSTRMGNPEIGDLVLERTTMNKVKAIDRIGRLKSITWEPMQGWEDEEEPAPNEKVWTIETLDGREFSWRNADFIVIPEDPWKHQARLPV